MSHECHKVTLDNHWMIIKVFLYCQFVLIEDNLIIYLKVPEIKHLIVKKGLLNFGTVRVFNN